MNISRSKIRQYIKSFLKSVLKEAVIEASIEIDKEQRLEQEQKRLAEEQKRLTEENERKERRRKLANEQKAKMDAIRKKERDSCQHMAGTSKLSDVVSPCNAFTSIVWHRYDDSIIRGICTICQRVFEPADSDYQFWKSKKSFNISSSSGWRGDSLFEGMAHPDTICLNHGVKNFSTGPDLEPITGWKENDDSEDMNDWSDGKLRETLKRIRQDWRAGRRESSVETSLEV
jgi:hypothetical protein